MRGAFRPKARGGGGDDQQGHDEDEPGKLETDDGQGALNSVVTDMVTLTVSSDADAVNDAVVTSEDNPVSFNVLTGAGTVGGLGGASATRVAEGVSRGGASLDALGLAFRDGAPNWPDEWTTHGDDGVNMAFADGGARWVPTGRELIEPSLDSHEDFSADDGSFFRNKLIELTDYERSETVDPRSGEQIPESTSR